MTRPTAPLQAQSRDTAFILGGTDQQHAWRFLGGMVQFNMQSRTFVNRSAPCFNATKGIDRGAMHYVPSFGPEGILIAMGGQNGNGSFGTSTLIDYSTVSVFDPAKLAWWNQTTTGTPPARRIEFCVAGINSTNGTYEMYTKIYYPRLPLTELILIIDLYTQAGALYAALQLSPSILPTS